MDGVTLKMAKVIATGARVRKKFEGGWFDGAVEEVTKDLKDPRTGGLYTGLLFLVR